MAALPDNAQTPANNDTDPQETRNVAASNAETVVKLFEALQAHRAAVQAGK